MHCTTEYRLVGTNPIILDRAIRLTQNHRLRGYDAVHLATALIVNEQYLAVGLTGLTFVAADGDLIAAAQMEGLATDDPHLQPLRSMCSTVRLPKPAAPPVIPA